MLFNISFVEKEEMKIKFEEILKALNLNFNEIFKNNNYIDFFEEYENSSFKIITKEQKILLKKIKINTNIKYKKNIDRGLFHIYSDENYKLEKDGCNFFIDCKVKIKKVSEATTFFAVKLDCSIDFGFNNLINKNIKSKIEKEIKNKIKKLIEA